METIKFNHPVKSYDDILRGLRPVLSPRQKANQQKREAFKAQGLIKVAPADRRQGARRDCTVRALSLVTGLEYNLAEWLAEKAGRQLNQGCHSWQLIDVAKAEGFKFYPIACGGTLGSFLAKRPKGRFYVQISRHAFAVIDGKAHDVSYLTPFVRLQKVWQFVP